MNIRETISGALAVCRYGLEPASPKAFLFALVCVAAATAIRALFGFDPVISLFAPYYVAALVATLVAGWAAGATAAGLGIVVLWLLLVVRAAGFPSISYQQTADTCLYIVVSAIIVTIAEQIRAARRRDREERDRLQLIIEELGHRLTNKLATTQAILRCNLADHPEVWAAVSGRLNAIAATDRLILEAAGRGADLRKVLHTELDPYGPERSILSGELVELPPRLALLLALVVHELATNAAKYGSLSVPEGRVAVSWALAGRHLTIHWTETEGPEVREPTRTGFGSKLIRRALQPYYGEIRTTYDPAGIRCAISLVLPEAGQVTPATLPSTDSAQSDDGARPDDGAVASHFSAAA